VIRSAKGLLPGQRFDTYYRVHPNTAAVVVRLYGVEPGVVQNQFFGDDILLSVHSAKTSAIGEGDYPVLTFTTGGTYVIPSPERGLMRVTLNGDWTNASPIDATVSIVSVTEPVPGLTTQGRLDDGQVRVLPFAVPPGAAKLSARLEWQGDWSSYPANDVDLILVQPDGQAVDDGASLNNPEVVEVDAPPAGDWLGRRGRLLHLHQERRPVPTPDRCGRRGAQVALGRAGRPVDLERITSVSRIGRSGSLLEDVRIDAPTGGRWH
jgi:hypothetical protein